MNKLHFKLFRLYNGLEGRLAPRRAAERAKQLFLTPRRFTPKPWEEQLEREGQRLTLRNELSVIRWGRGLRRALLVHGWESRATHLGDIARFLRNEGYEVYGLDAPAHGKSSGKKAHPVAFKRAIEQTEDELGPFDLVLGHSMGAASVAAALAEGLPCDRAVLVAPPADVLSVMQRFCDFIGLPVGATRAFVQSMEQEVGVPTSALDLRQMGKRVQCPVLILHDRQDAEIPVLGSLELAQQWPTASLRLTEGEGHRRVLRSQQLLQALKPFLAQQQGRPRLRTVAGIDQASMSSTR